jgi:hypothetical protein
MRKASLAGCWHGGSTAFLYDFEHGEIGPNLFRYACLMGLEGMVSKHRESSYRNGRFGSRSRTGSIRRSPASLASAKLWPSA